MEIDTAMHLINSMLKIAVLVASPVLLICLVIGLLISIFQVVTQIQEMTLTFVPKLLAAVLIIAIFGRWMLLTVAEYAKELITNMPLQ